MVLLLCLWEKVKKWSSQEEMRESHFYGDGKHYSVEQDYQQMSGLRRLEDGNNIRSSSHYYPEGGWGWIVCACAFLAHVTTSGAQLSAGALHIVLSNKFENSYAQHWLGPLSWSISCCCSPLVVNLCRRKNVRIIAIIGGFLFPLALLFTSFATELHQIFFSFGVMGGIGCCIVRESSGVVLGEYFRRRRQFVEQVVLAGTGVGVTLFSLLYLSFTRHLEWSQGFQIGAALSVICLLLPAFYRAASRYNPTRNPAHQRKSPSSKVKSGQSNAEKNAKRVSSIFIPLCGDICKSLKLFCVPSLKPLLWSAAISSFGIYGPLFLMSDLGRNDLSAGSLLLLQTHLGLGLSLGVILGAILTLKKFQCCQISLRALCCSCCCLTGISMIAISTVKGYYGYSLSAWVYGIALGSYVYTIKVLTMELTRTKHWSRIWSCVQSLMSPGVLIGTGLTSYVGKPGFFGCATCVLIGAGLIGFNLIDLTSCGSPGLSSNGDNDSPIPPAPPPITPNKYVHGSSKATSGFYPLRRSISLQQPFYPMPCYARDLQNLYPYYCRDCFTSNPSLYPMNMVGGPNSMIRSYSLPQQVTKNTGTQTNPNSPEKKREQASSASQLHPSTHKSSMLAGSEDILFRSLDKLAAAAAVAPSNNNSMIINVSSKPTKAHPHSTNEKVDKVSNNMRRMASYKSTVMFASNPQLFPSSVNHSSATSTTDREESPLHNTLRNQYRHHYHHNHHSHHHGGIGAVGTNGHHAPVPSSSIAHYTYREERRANFIKSQQQTIDDGRGIGSPGFFPVMTTSVEHHPQPHLTLQKTPEKKISFPRRLRDMAGLSDKEEELKRQQHVPAFNRLYFDSSKMLSTEEKQRARINPLSVAQSSSSNSRTNQQLPLQDKFFKHPRYERMKDPYEDDPDPPYYPTNWNLAQKLSSQQQNQPKQQYGVQQKNLNVSSHGNKPNGSSHNMNPPPSRDKSNPSSSKVSSFEFDVDEPKFNSLRRPTPQIFHQGDLINYPSPSIQAPQPILANHYHHYPESVIAPRVVYAPNSSPCPYCDVHTPPPLSLSVPTMPPNNPHYLCHFGHPPLLRRRNTWHFHKDQLEAMTTSV